MRDYGFIGNKLFGGFVNPLLPVAIFTAVQFGSCFYFFFCNFFSQFKKNVHFIGCSRKFFNFQDFAVIKIEVAFGEPVKPFFGKFQQPHKTDEQRQMRCNIFFNANAFQKFIKFCFVFKKELPVSGRVFKIEVTEIIHMFSKPVGKLHPLFQTEIV